MPNDTTRSCIYYDRNISDIAILINTDNERKVYTTQLEMNHNERERYPEFVGAADHLGPNITRELRLAESHYHRFDNLVCIDKMSSIKRKFGETLITTHICKDQVWDYWQPQK